MSISAKSSQSLKAEPVNKESFKKIEDELKAKMPAITKHEEKMLWGVDGIKPTVWDLVGGSVALVCIAIFICLHQEIHERHIY